MLKLLDYTTTEQLYISNNVGVYRGYRVTDKLPVIIKCLQNQYPNPKQIAQLHHEYTIASHLNIEGIIKPYALLKQENQWFIVAEDIKGDSLKDILAVQRLDLATFLHIAIQLSDILGEIHSRNIIHKDIKPGNIIVNLATNQVKITDFSISTQLSSENLTINNLNALEGTLAYLSPEQTGRMNRALDYRTDFYSLGIVFYEILVGHVPFTMTDSMEIVHCHLAKTPPSPHTLNPAIPHVISHLIMKLLAKMPESRYQSAYGIKYDLMACLRQLQSTGKIEEFTCGEFDFSDRFQIPQKLYGRDAEIATLLQVFRQVSQGSTELMLVAGYSGIGKSALVQEVHTSVTRQRGYFISGKFDQLQRNIPYSAVVAAFTNLIRQLLTESEAQLSEWKAKLLAALGSNGQVIIDVIPEVELLIGKQPAVPVLGAVEAQYRFNLVFQNFFKVFCQANHPLIIFLDDLQWADSASLKLIPLILTNTPYLLLVGAYRDNEVTPTHPLMLMLADVQKNMGNFHTLTLTALSLPDVTHFVADTLKTSPEIAAPLANLLIEKTAGNPFFMGVFLKALYTEKLIKFDLTEKAWQWDITQIKAKNITDNVVELMSVKVRQLDDKTQHLLKLAACVGNQFTLNTLTHISAQSETAIKTDLWQAVAEGLILPIGDAYKFVHDRIQQATYSLIPEQDKPLLHHRIGQLLLENVKTPEERLFEIVDHLNVGISLLEEQTERNALARLNLQAGQKAKSATAYQAAFVYLQTGISILATESWKTDYDLTLALYQEAAETAYLNNNFVQMQVWVEIVLQQAKNTLDKIKVYEARIASYTSQNQPLQAIQTALEILAQLGITFPESPTDEDIQQALNKTIALIPSAGIQSLIDLPAMTDPNALAALRILSTMNPPCYIAAPRLFVVEVFSQVHLSLQYNNTDISPYSYVCCAILFNGMANDMETAYQFGQLALDLAIKLDARQIKSKTWFVFANFVSHSKRHLRESLPLFSESYQSGLESGDLEHVGFSLAQKSQYGYFVGQELSLLDKEAVDHCQTLTKIQQGVSLNLLQMARLAFAYLLAGQFSHSFNLNHEGQLLDSLTQANDYTGLFHFHVHKIILNYLLGNPEQAYIHAMRSDPLLGSAPGYFTVPIFYFYDSLVCLARYNTVKSAEQTALLAKVTDNQQKLQKRAHHAAMNFQHKYDLVEAEKARVLGQFELAAKSYEKAIQGAKENEYLQEEALGYELAAKFYLQHNMEKIAHTYLEEAHYCYQNWGAIAKVKQLEKQYPTLLAQPSMTQSLTMTQTSHQHLTSTMTQSLTHTVGSGSTLDLATLMKASQAISGERVFEQLMQKLMRIVIENAGAELGYLILEKSGQGLFVEVYGTTEQVQLLDSIPLTTINSDKYALSNAIVMYAVRTQNAVVLNHATQEGLFTKDEYVLKRQPKSILCTPILHKNQLVGLLYLENNLTTGVFNPNRLLTVNLLSSQIAISLENVHFYQQLEQARQEIQQHADTLEIKVAERTTELAQANQAITLLNQRLKAENVRMGAELDIARQLQLMVLPKETELTQIAGLDIAAFMEPAAEVGGDYYDVLQHEGRVKIAIGDVTGHGLESGILMLMVQTAIRTLLTSHITEAKDFLTFLNRTIHDNAKRMNSDKNLTLCLLDYQTGQVRITGQHEEVLLVRKDGKVECIDTFDLGFSIGVEANIDTFVNQLEVQLNQGDGIVLYTDGITEARNTAKQQYGIKRLCQIVSENWQRPVVAIKDAVIADVKQHIGLVAIYDDITLLVLKQK